MKILLQADADTDRGTSEFHTVTLDASGSFDPKNGNLSYQWTQTAGTQVRLSDNQAALTTFDAPRVGLTSEKLTFYFSVIQSNTGISPDEIWQKVRPYVRQE